MSARLRRHAAWFVAGLIAALVAPAMADYKDDYKEGFLAVEREQWTRAEVALRSAIAANPTAGGRPIAVYGRRFEPYVPHYLLGLALYRQGNVVGALAAWEEAERQGEVQKARSFRREFEKLLAEARAANPVRISEGPTEPTVPTPEPIETLDDTGPSDEAVEAAAARAESALSEASREAGRVDADLGSDEVQAALARNGSLATKRRQAEDRLDFARRDLDTGRQSRDLELIERAAQEAEAASGQFAELRQEVALEIESFQRASQVAADEERDRRAREIVVRTRIGELRIAGESALSEADRVPTPTPQLKLERAQLARLVDEAAEAGTMELDGLERLERSLGVSIAAVGEAVETSLASPADPGAPIPTPGADRPPTELRRAVEAYFEADYDGVAQALGTVEFEDMRAQAQAHLFRAAASFALSRSGRSDSDQMVERARAEVRDLRSIQPSFSPDPGYFSPAFLTFFEGS